MTNLIVISLIGLFRDRIFFGILALSTFFLAVPVTASLSMRQVTELSLTLSLSLVSLILLTLAVFLGGIALWRDIERRYIFSVLGLPLSRSSYIWGKFVAVAIFLLFVSVLLGVTASLVVLAVTNAYPPERPVQWVNVAVAIGFDTLKFVLLTAIAFLFSTISTNFFLPVCGTVALFLVGNSTQEAYDFLHSANAASISPVVKTAATTLYYVLPNFSAFNLKVNAIYGLPLSMKGIAFTGAYFLIYTSIIMTLATIVFMKREFK